MRFKENIIDGIPLLAPTGIDLPSNLEDFPPSCGPGDGIGELIVPDSLLGLCITPACWIHDQCWSMSKASWGDFHVSNSLFLTNLVSLVKNYPLPFPLGLLKPIRLILAISYYEAVASQSGAAIFWKLKQVSA